MKGYFNSGKLVIEGLSTDTKPALGTELAAFDKQNEYKRTFVIEGSGFREMDTGDYYLIDSAGTWHVQPAGGSPRY